MADASRKLIEVGIVLQGGGALGAYECGGVTALLELMDEAQAAGRPVALKSVVDIDMQSPNAKGKVLPQASTDDEFGLRDFSTDTVKRRRDAGYKLAHERLAPVFAAA